MITILQIEVVRKNKVLHKETLHPVRKFRDEAQIALYRSMYKSRYIKKHEIPKTKTDEIEIIFIKKE